MVEDAREGQPAGVAFRDKALRPESGQPAAPAPADRGPAGERVAGSAGHEEAKRVRVLIVDDHVLVREGTRQVLSQVPDVEVAGQARTAEEALALLGVLRLDVALVDVNLPTMSGLELARVAAERYPEVRILVVSAYDDHAYVAEALEVGVGGYLLKSASARELVDAVRAVADGVFVLDRDISRRLARRWRQASPAGEALAPGGALTRRETEVLDLLAQGLPNKHIAAQLGLGLRTIEGHVSSLLGKLGVGSRTEAVRYALDHHLVGAQHHAAATRLG